MATAKKAKIQIEAGQTKVPFVALTDSGDRKVFNPADLVVSGTIEVLIRPNGIVTGNNLLSVGSAADKVAVAAFSAYSEGTLHSVASAEQDITRPATDVAKVCSITMTDAGAIAVVAGTDGTDGTFSEVRGEAGAPPYIAVDSVELGQVRMTTSAAAVLTSSEIVQNGQYTERADYPVFAINPIGYGKASTIAGKVTAFVEFSDVLEASHTGDLPKKVYMEYYVPSFADEPKASDWVPAETSHSVSSEEYYGGSIASSSESLGQASFKTLLNDGVTDAIVGMKNTSRTVRVYPDRNKTPYMLTQGMLGIGRAFPVSGQINASVTITAEVASAEFSG